EFRKVTSARELFKKYLKTIVETGMPYLFFKDTTNAMNPNKHCGFIGNANLCTESFSNFSPTRLENKTLSKDGKIIEQKMVCAEAHTCNLVSINFAVVDDYDCEEITRLAVRLLDNTVDVSKP